MQNIANVLACFDALAVRA